MVLSYENVKRNVNIEYITSIIGTLLFATFYSYLEYYWKPWERYNPIPEFHIGYLSSYNMLIMAPVVIFISFMPFIDDLLTIYGNPIVEKLRTFSLGIGNVMLLIMSEDMLYFVWRIFPS